MNVLLNLSDSVVCSVTYSHLTAVWRFRGAQQAQRLLIHSKVLLLCIKALSVYLNIHIFVDIFKVFSQCIFWAYVAFRCSWVVLMRSRDLLHKQFSCPEGFVLSGRMEQEGSVDQGHIFHRSAWVWAPSLGRSVPGEGLPWSIVELWHTKTSACWWFCFFVWLLSWIIHQRQTIYSLAQG